MAKKASKKKVIAKAVVASEEGRNGFIDPSRYSRTTFLDPKTGKTRHSAGNGDAVATALLHVSNDKLDTIARANKVPDFVGREFVNQGQRRMALGNRLRGMVRKGDPVVIGEHSIRKLDQRVPLPDVDREKSVVEIALREDR